MPGQRDPQPGALGPEGEDVVAPAEVAPVDPARGQGMVADHHHPPAPPRLRWRPARRRPPRPPSPPGRRTWDGAAFRRRGATTGCRGRRGAAGCRRRAPRAPGTRRRAACEIPAPPAGGDPAALPLHRVPPGGAPRAPVVVAGDEDPAGARLAHEVDLRVEPPLRLPAPGRALRRQPGGIDVVAEEDHDASAPDRPRAARPAP